MSAEVIPLPIGPRRVEPFDLVPLPAWYVRRLQSVETNDGKSDMQETARDVARFLSSPSHAMSAGSRESSVVIPSGSVDYVELG